MIVKSLFKILIIVCTTTALIHLCDGLWISAKASLAQHLIAHQWQQTIERGGHHKPWPWADTWPVGQLRFNQHTTIVMEGGQGATLAFAPGRLPESQPANEGSVIIAGHRDTHFASLQKLRSGDLIDWQDTSGRWHHYRMSRHFVVDMREESLTLSTQTQQLLLITCYPFDELSPNTPLRFVIAAEPITREPISSKPVSNT